MLQVSRGSPRRSGDEEKQTSRCSPIVVSGVVAGHEVRSASRVLTLLFPDHRNTG
jgi:hypothetical protein